MSAASLGFRLPVFPPLSAFTSRPYGVPMKERETSGGSGLRAGARWRRAALLSVLVGLAPLVWLSGGVAGSTSMAATTTRPGRFTVTSPVLKDGGTLPTRFTCDGSSVNPPIRWSRAPKGTKSYAVVMHHVPGPGDVHWYWVVYGIPANITALAEASTAVGALGTNSVNGRNEYTPSSGARSLSPSTACRSSTR